MKTIISRTQVTDDEKLTRLIIERNNLDTQTELEAQNKANKQYLLQAKSPAIEYPKLRDTNDNQVSTHGKQEGKRKESRRRPNQETNHYISIKSKSTTTSRTVSTGVIGTLFQISH